VGPAFIALLGNKYGYRPFPAHIEQTEFDKLLGSLESDGADTTTLREHFRLDLNGDPACYVLKSNDSDDAEWLTRYEVMQRQLRDAAMKVLEPQDAEKYRISVTEAEVRSGIIDNSARREQVRPEITVEPRFQHLPEPNRACLVRVYAFLIWNNLCDLVYQTPTKSYQSQIPGSFRYTRSRDYQTPTRHALLDSDRC